LLSLPLFQRPKGFLACHSITPPYHPEWDISPPTGIEKQRLEDIFSQRFHYLGSGVQAYAFESEDGKYILKFFRMNRLIPRVIHTLQPKKIAERHRKLHLIFNAYKLVYEKFRQDAGLLYIHLNKSGDLKKIIHIQDHKKREHAIQLDDVPFVVQEKAELLHDRFDRLKAEKKFDELQKAIEAFLTLVQRRVDAGMIDQDRVIEKNYGFVGDRPIQIDVGSVGMGSEPGEYDRIAASLAHFLE
jgi:hypothetical protein